jgi:DNA repair exonuclease SbcCD ATPase subunit
MTSFEPIISKLRVEAFRGFRDVREFDLSAAAVVVTGPNGTGKTSFFDALQWGLLGTLERLESLRARRNVEYVVNQYRQGLKATVEIDLTLASGPVTVKRTGDQGGSTLELRRPGDASLFGDEAESELRNLLLPRTDLTLESALTTSGLMQQDVMRRVLEAKASDRYRQLSTVLGLASLEDFEDAAKSVAKAAAGREQDARTERARHDEALRQAQARLQGAQARLASRPQVAAVREEAVGIMRSSPPGLSVASVAVLERPQDVRLAATAWGRASETVESVRALILQADRLRAAVGEIFSEEDVDRLRSVVEVAQAERDRLETSRGVAQRQLNTARLTAADVAKLAAIVVPMLSDNCPVCGQHIDPEHVERELRERSEGTEAMIELERVFVERQNEFSRAAGELRTAQDELAEAEQSIERTREAHVAELAASTALSALVEDNQLVRFDVSDAVSFLDVADAAIEYFRSVRRALHDLLETFDRQSDQGAVERAEAEIRSLETALSSAEQQVAGASARSQKLQALAENTIQARIEVTEARLRSIQPLVANIFQRLDPHPAFKTVEFELDTYYRKGTTSPLVIDQVENVSADPLMIFSTSQANIVALAYFIAMSLSSEERGLPFLLLDDPVQSMDDVNVLGFADLCRHLRTRRQLIVSTHERRFASLLERKLAPRTEDSRTKIIRFTGWDRSGPTVEESFVEAQLLDDPIRMVRLVG